MSFSLFLQASSDQDRFIIDQMMYEEASRGSGSYAIDEFDSQCRWNRKLLRKAATLVLKLDDSKEIIGSAILGNIAEKSNYQCCNNVNPKFLT